MIVITQQDYDMFWIEDIIDDDKLDEYCKWFYNRCEKKNDSIYICKYKPEYRDNHGSITWEYDKILRPIEELPDYAKNNRTSFPETQKAYFGFEYRKMDMNNFIKMNEEKNKIDEIIRNVLINNNSHWLTKEQAEYSMDQGKGIPITYKDIYMVIERYTNKKII